VFICVFGHVCARVLACVCVNIGICFKELVARWVIGILWVVIYVFVA
jgi:hypothetical protein